VEKQNYKIFGKVYFLEIKRRILKEKEMECDGE
jgi:hypothetical protein